MPTRVELYRKYLTDRLSNLQWVLTHDGEPYDPALVNRTKTVLTQCLEKFDQIMQEVKHHANQS